MGVASLKRWVYFICFQKNILSLKETEPRQNCVWFHHNILNGDSSCLLPKSYIPSVFLSKTASVHTTKGMVGCWKDC